MVMLACERQQVFVHVTLVSGIYALKINSTQLVTKNKTSYCFTPRSKALKGDVVPQPKL